METTPTYALPYPELSDPPHGPSQMRALAEGVEAELVRVDGNVDTVANAVADLQNEPIPGTRIATEVVTESSVEFTEQTTLITIDAELVAGRTYRIRVSTSIATTNTGDNSGIRIRLDDEEGTQLQFRQQSIDTSNSLGVAHTIEVEYTAPATTTQTFAFTAERRSGTGTFQMEAANNRITYMTVDYLY